MGDAELGRPNLVNHYKRLLSPPEQAPGAETEDVDPHGGDPDLSEGGIQDRLGATRAELRAIVKEHLGDEQPLYDIVDEIVRSGDGALHALREDDEEGLLASPSVFQDLEVIVRTDGSRPSFMVRDGSVDTSTSPVGAWADTMTTSADLLRSALACVGRIDLPGAPQGFAGTGFLVHENLIVTNRHVLQEVAVRDGDGGWQIKPDVVIDFGHEFRARASVNPRALTKVVFAGSQPIDPRDIDHAKLDLAVVEIGAGAAPTHVLAVDEAPDWAEPEQEIFAVGYPGRPRTGSHEPTLLEQLFQSTFGHKRLAPGLITSPTAAVRDWTLAHDATTLGGNSGSVVLVVGREFAAAGLHYGGRSSAPRENWGHVFGQVLAQPDGGDPPRTLRDCLSSYGVQFVDRATGGSSTRVPA